MISEPFTTGTEKDDTDTIEDLNIVSVRRRKRQVPQEVPLTAKLQVKVSIISLFSHDREVLFGN